MNMRRLLRTAGGLLLVLCAGCLLLAPAARAGAVASPAAPDFAAIDSYVAEQMRELRVPGLALGIVRDDQIVHLQSFGVAGPAGTPVGPQTPFLLGSTSKSFTALAIMQLVGAGQLQLDAPVQRYLPWFRVADPAASARITLRNLLNHTSGLPTAAETDQQDRDTSASALETAVRRLGSVQLDRPVGTTFEYANSNYVVLGLVVQVVSGQPYELYIQDRIFAPLDMTHSYASIAEAQQHGLATGYRYWLGFPIAAPNLPYNRSHTPAGALVSSAEDMSHYLIAQLNDGIYAGRPLVSADGVAQLHTPAVVWDAHSQYAMGWIVAAPAGVPIVTHSGDNAEYHSDMVLIPARERGRWGVVVLTNVNARLAPVGTSLKGIVWGVVSRITGRVIPPPEPNYLQYWLPMGFGAALLLLMLARLTWSVRNIRRWRRLPAGLIPGRAGIWRAGLPLLWDAALVVFFLVGLPRLIPASPAELEFRQPDMFWLLGLSFLVAVTWGPLRTLLIALALRPRAPAVPAPTPAPAPAH